LVRTVSFTSGKHGSSFLVPSPFVPICFRFKVLLVLVRDMSCHLTHLPSPRKDHHV
jgi:hypothetical protein